MSKPHFCIPPHGVPGLIIVHYINIGRIHKSHSGIHGSVILNLSNKRVRKTIAAVKKNIYNLNFFFCTLIKVNILLGVYNANKKI